MAARGTDGIVLVAALLLMLLLSALGAAFALISSSETLIAANFRDMQEAQYAADAAAERALVDVAAAGDWTLLLNGTVQSTFTDGVPSGTRTVPGGTTIDLTQIVNKDNCHKVTSCSRAEMDASTADRPRGANNPRWQLFAYGRIRDVLSIGTIDSACYTVVLVGDDAGETDGDPQRDSSPPDPGAGMLALRAHAFGPRNSHRIIELTAARTADGHVRVLSWRPS